MWCSNCHYGSDKYFPSHWTQKEGVKDKWELVAYPNQPCTQCGDVKSPLCDSNPFPPKPLGMGGGDGSGKTHRKRWGREAKRVANTK